jgi:hypothetical protein
MTCGSLSPELGHKPGQSDAGAGIWGVSGVLLRFQNSSHIARRETSYLEMCWLKWVIQAALGAASRTVRTATYADSSERLHHSQFDQASPSDCLCPAAVNRSGRGERHRTGQISVCHQSAEFRCINMMRDERLSWRKFCVICKTAEWHYSLVLILRPVAIFSLI